MRWIRVSPFVVVMLLLIGSVQAALAHAEYVSSDPGSGATVASAPAKVSITFSEDLDPNGTTVKVLGPAGQDVTAGKPDISVSATKVATVPINAAGNGTYTVNWHSVSDDDKHAEDGSFTFNVGAASSGQIAPATGHADPGFGGLRGNLELATGLGGLLLLMLGVALRFRRAQ